MSMKIETLEEQIKKRAQEEVQKRVAAFKTTVYRTIEDLLGRPSTNTSWIKAHGKREDVRNLLRVLASDDNTKGWPSELWRSEEQRLRDEILSRMDELQRVLLAKNLPADEIEAEPAPESEDAA